MKPSEVSLGKHGRGDVMIEAIGLTTFAVSCNSAGSVKQLLNGVAVRNISRRMVDKLRREEQKL